MVDELAVRVVTDVATLDKEFDYAVPEGMVLEVGDQVRVPLGGRRVSGWVTGFVPVDGRDLKAILKRQGDGPPTSLIELARWAGDRWFASPGRFLVAASSLRRVHHRPVAPAPRAPEAVVSVPPGLWRVGATTDPLDLVLAALSSCAERPGSFLILVPTSGWAARLGERLRRRGFAVASGEGSWPEQRAGWPVIVGTRGDAWAPTPRLSGAVILDADDEAFVSESSPTYHAAVVVAERCRRDDAPLWLTSVMAAPLLGTLTGNCHVARGATSDWPVLHVVDRRGSDPRDGTLAAEIVDACHEALAETTNCVAVAVVLQRLGTGRLLACGRCHELVRCEQCGGAEISDGGDVCCPRCSSKRPAFCRSCGATNVKAVRSGVTTLARDVAAQLQREVVEVTAATTSLEPAARVVVGTEAIFRLVRRCGVVVFVDFDQYLLAPRERARRDAVAVVAKAGRLVGDGEVWLQTRRGSDPLLDALRARDVAALEAEDEDTARVLGLAPFRASAQLGGASGAEFAAALRGAGVTVSEVGDEFVVEAATHDELRELLHRAKRPAGALRVAVSP